MRRLQNRILTEHGLEHESETAEAETRLKDDTIFRVLEYVDRIVGCYGLSRMSASTCMLKGMFLEKAFRGKGLGKDLLEDAIRIAKAEGYETMALETHSAFEAALGLYRAFGFEAYGAEKLSSRCNTALKKRL